MQIKESITHISKSFQAKLPPLVKQHSKTFSVAGVILVIFLLIALGRYNLSRQSQDKLAVNPEPTIVAPTDEPVPTDEPTPTSSAVLSKKAPTLLPKITSEPQINCTGPDGKQFKSTQKACDDFNKAWVKAPTSSPTSSNTPTQTQTQTSTTSGDCAGFNPGGDIGQLTVTIQPQAGQTIVGDTSVRIDKWPGCPSVDPGWPYTQILTQGQTTANFGGMRPGPFQIKVGYHGNYSEHKVNLSSGSNSLTVTVVN